MFVIVRTFDSLDPMPETAIERVAQTMKHAGVAITVTSVTDFIAFAVGCTTVSDIYSFHS